MSLVGARGLGAPVYAAAHRLGLSHSTVKHHLANARSKVGGTTTQLVWNLAPRLLEPEDRALNTEHLICVGRVEGWLVVPALDRPRGQRAMPVGS